MPNTPMEEWSTEQAEIGKRIHERAKELGVNNLILLHDKITALPKSGVLLSQSSFEAVLRGRPSPQFTHIVDAAVQVLIAAQESRAVEPSTQPEIDLKKRQLRHFFMEGDDEDEYELHEVERYQKEEALNELERKAAVAGWKMHRYDWGEGLTNPSFNKSLVLSPPKIAVDKKTKEWLAYDGFWHPDISGHVVRAARKKSRHLTNDRKIRIASDFLGNSTVVLQPTRYFASLATDQIAWFRFSTSKTKPDGTPERMLWDGMDAFIDRDGRLKGFAQCAVSNQLGASVMAFTKDGEMLVVHQNKLNHQSVGRLAPSGSGSLDWDDVEDRTDFLDIARYGAKRELDEECVLVDKDGGYSTINSEVLLTGFVRMVHRAGKPEFFGIAKIDATSDEICARKPERYVEKVFIAQIDKANWNKPASPQIARMCRTFLEQHRGFRSNSVPLSYPLQHLLNHLSEVCDDREQAAVIDAFMRPMS